MDEMQVAAKAMESMSEEQIKEVADKVRADHGPPKLTPNQKKTERRVKWALRAARWFPKWVGIPPGASGVVADSVRDTGESAGRFLEFLRNIASYKYRREVHLSDKEIEEMIQHNVVALLQTNREHVIEFNWILMSGNAEAYDRFRSAVGLRIEELRAAEAVKVPVKQEA